MTIYSHIQQAYVNLVAAKLRSFLAVLGILVGTASIVALISCGQLATEKALAQFKTLGTDLLSVTLYQKASDMSQSGRDNIPLAFWRQVPNMVQAVRDVAPYGIAYKTVSYQGRKLNGVVVGADESLARVMNIELDHGYFVSFTESFEHYCVIGTGVAKQLRQHGVIDPIGKSLRIGQAIYTVIGVAKPWKENAFFNEDVNQAVIVPIAGMPLINKDSKINHAVLLLKPNNDIDAVIADINQILSQQAPKLSAFIRSAKQIIVSMESQGRIFTLLLAVIGSISLLVGGIGVMNVMLVSVSERKKEIGIRKAVGAKNHEIQALFLIESMMLSLFGGFFGILLGLGVTGIIAYFSQWPFLFYWIPILVGFTVSVVVGVFFGFYPARRAACLEPVVSLRSEV